MAIEPQDPTTNGKPTEAIAITPARFSVLAMDIVGTAPYVQAKFAEKAMRQMAAQMEAGSTAKKGKKRDPRDFDRDYHGAMHQTATGRYGIPAAAFRNAAIDACRMAGFAMTRAKMSIFIMHDDIDATDGSPLVYITGEPQPLEMAVRNTTGVADIRVRPQWVDWRVSLRVRFDADQFTKSDVANLFERAGVQVGVGEGRPYSKNSNGLGFGTFRIAMPGED